MFKRNRKKAFTLIELIVVVAITAMVTTMVFANMRSGGRSGDVNASVEKLAGVIKQAQMMALSGKLIDGSRPLGGYGVYLDTLTSPDYDSYILFANTYEPTNYKYDAENDTIIQTIKLGDKIRIDTVAGYSIIFVPPRSNIYISKGIGIDGNHFIVSDEPVLISLKHDDINFYAYVRVNSQGEIDVRKTE